MESPSSLHSRKIKLFLFGIIILHIATEIKNFSTMMNTVFHGLSLIFIGSAWTLDNYKVLNSQEKLDKNSELLSWKQGILLPVIAVISLLGTSLLVGIQSDLPGLAIRYALVILSSIAMK